jgi:hypothetical protein
MLSKEHPDTFTTIANLAATYQKKVWWNGAEVSQVRVI